MLKLLPKKKRGTDVNGQSWGLVVFCHCAWWKCLNACKRGTRPIEYWHILAILFLLPHFHCLQANSGGHWIYHWLKTIRPFQACHCWQLLKLQQTAGRCGRQSVCSVEVCRAGSDGFACRVANSSFTHQWKAVFWGHVHIRMCRSKRGSTGWARREGGLLGMVEELVSSCWECSELHYHYPIVIQ